MRQFRVEQRPHRLVHLIFDAPGRSMNVFSNEAIHELAAFARWLSTADVAGVVICSGKSSAFCVGADLNELGAAYDMIVALPPGARFEAAYEHFFPLSAAIRTLETCGKPIAAAIGGLALGGGCELAMGAHYRVLTDTPQAALGLPESLVGLLPGGGGTQRLPRLVGLPGALPVLLRGARLTGAAALESGLVSQLVPAGQEIAAAEQWLLSGGTARQPWDSPEWPRPSAAALLDAIGETRMQVLAETLGHYPAPLAILDCLELGLPRDFDAAIREEMAIFARLIQRAEPRNMIQSLFLGKGEYERLARRGQLPGFVPEVVAAVHTVVSAQAHHAAALAMAGFSSAAPLAVVPVRPTGGRGYWVDDEGAGPQRLDALAALEAISAVMAPFAARLSLDEQRLADYAAVRDAGYPAYLGGPFAFRRRDLPGAAEVGTVPSR